MGPWAIPIAIAAGQAILGMYQGRQQQKAQTNARHDQARINMYAPLFGQQVQALGPEQDHVSTGMMQGALSGFQMGQQYNMNEKLGALYDAEIAKKTAAGDTSLTNASAPTPISNPYAADPAMMSVGAPEPSPYSYGRPILNPDIYFGRFGGGR